MQIRFLAEGGSKKESFDALVFEGALLPFYFLKVGDRLIPILPRRYSAILLAAWARIFKKHEKKLNKEGDYSMHLPGEIHGFLRRRIRSESLFPFVSAVTKDKKPHEVLFSSSFISKDRLILIYTLAPFSSGKELSKRLSAAAPRLKKALDLISSPPIRLGLHVDKQTVEFGSDQNGEHLKPELLIVLPQTSTQLEKIELPEDLPGTVVFLDQFLGLIDELESVDEVTEFLEYLEETELSKFPFSLLDKFASF